jgi:hypothetical protein
VWTSTNLQLWTKDTVAVQAPGTADSNGVQTVAVTVSASPASGKLFVQVRAE